MSTYRITRDGQTWQLRDDPDGELADLLAWIIDERCDEVVALTRQQVVARLGRVSRI